MSVYPATRAGRRAVITAARPPVGRAHDPWKPAGTAIDEEPDERGLARRVGTIFLTGAECPWRCAMCDLWQHTIETATPAGALPAQIRAALPALDPATTGVTRIKLYNAGSFFDPRAVPPVDIDEIVNVLDPFERVIVESHPALLGPSAIDLRDRLQRRRPSTAGPVLEVAIGIETAHPDALEQLDKRVDLADFTRTGTWLTSQGIALRVFLLINPPFIPDRDQEAWLAESVRFAASCQAWFVSLIPTRPGNGTTELLAAEGRFRAPTLGDVERAFALALRLPGLECRVTVDPWDVDRLATCLQCAPARRARLQQMNLAQQVLPAARCRACGETAAA